MAMRIILMISMMQMMLWGGAGDLDSSFGGDGKVTTVTGSNINRAHSVAIQSDGKIVAAGQSKDNGGNDDFALVRYNTNGSLDSSFDDDGIVITPIGSSNDHANGVAIQSDGKIILAGESYSGSKYDFAAVRYNTNGSLDSSFNDDGIVTTDIGSSGWDFANGVAIQSDGKIVVVGHSGNGSGNKDFTVVRYDTNGSLDSTFDGDGIVTTDIGRDDIAYSVAIQSDGKIVVAGESENGNYVWDFVVVRYDTNGSLDSTFDDDGIVTTDFGSGTATALGVAIQSDGKIVTAGYSKSSVSGRDFALVRYDTDGSLDNTFSDDGKVTTDIGSDFDMAFSIAIQSEGKIVAAGKSKNGSDGEDFTVVRYDTNGSLDSTFDDDGIVTTDFGSGTDTTALSVTIQSDGKIVAAGSSYDGNDFGFAMVRYMGDSTITLAPIYYLLQ